MDPWLILLAAAVVVLFVLWRLADAKASRTVFDRTAAERLRIELELSLAEQRGRLGIIGELQDGAVLSVSRLISQAEGVRYTAAGDPQAALRAASAMVDAGKAALADMRRAQTILQGAIQPDGETVARPDPGLDSTEDLIRVMREAGLEVSLTESGERFPLKPGAELAILRILQGALGNALTHGGSGTEARITFTWTQDGLQLLVDDDLKALSARIAGAGITQMRERTQAFGGIFSAATVPGVGFSVSAIFPSLRFHNGVHGVNLSR